MYQLKNAAKRVAALTAAVGMMAGITSTAFPALVFADAYNPLTERSLMLSSSSPGWAFTDGSGNATYAPPGSGPNGQKSGETFSFKVSTDSSVSPTVKGFSFQYCTAPAGTCILPGDLGETQTPVDKTTDQESNLSVVYPTPVENTNFNVYVDADDDNIMDAGEVSTGWTMTTDRKAASGGTTENNFITLGNATGINPPSGQRIFIVFKATDTHYITNPGSGAFFVKINDYDTEDPNEMYDESGWEDHVIDGGVTVANVMNESIWITTKVLETMAFSVGTENPDMADLTDPAKHGACDPITVNDRIQLGDTNAEFSLSPNEAFDATSWWRLATNSSGGATVYYSGDTLWNTVGDNIDAIGAAAETSHPGEEQFGLALDSSYNPTDYDDMITVDLLTPSNLTPLTADAVYDAGEGEINAPDLQDNDAEFAFDTASLLNPAKIASYYADVINCSTGKMRYLANIAPATPAGVYTTKINYIAAPQY